MVGLEQGGQARRMHLVLYPSLNSLKHIFLRFFMRKQEEEVRSEAA